MLLIFAFLICINATHAMIYVIGNDTIHVDNGLYYKISITDTFNIDTSLIFIRYSSLANANEKLSIENTYHLTKIKEYIFGWTSYSYGENQVFIELARFLDQEALIEMIEYNTEVHYLCEEQIPSDKYFNNYPNPDQWYLNTIQAPFAWALTTGNPDVKVGIIDVGFDWEHPDLGPGEDGYDNIYLNQSTVPNQGEDAWNPWNDPTAHNPDDDDNNGYYNDWKGWGEMNDENHYPTFYNGNDARNYSKDFLIHNGFGLEKWYHGTFIAGIIGAKTNNDIGIAGIAGGWQTKGSSLIFYKIGLYGSVAGGIDYLVNQLSYFKADIIEMAFSTPQSDVIDAAILNAYNNGVFLIAAAGNHTPGSVGWQVTYPANNEYVYAVGATDLNDYHKPESNLGDGLDISAPGEDIYGLIPTDGMEWCNDCYDNYIDGNTSAASAMVAGTAALMLSVNPDISNVDIKNILNETADKVHLDDPYEYNDDDWCWFVGHGRLNTYKAVCKAWSIKEEDNIIDISETWNDDRTYFNSVFVTGHSTLTITSEIQFGPEAKLIIDVGSSVIVNGGILTNIKCCDLENESWPGIEVWGNKNETQYASSAQGKLILNGATIENAVTAVELWQPEVSTSTGGIIYATDALFLNNSRSIHAIDYKNHLPGSLAEVDNLCNFTNCTFNVDNQYIGDKTFYKHIDLDRVRGIKFYGCSFTLDHRAENVSQWNAGIAAYNAGFNVLPTCSSHVVPCPLIDSCRFNGFNKAIGVWTPAQLVDPPILINNAHFKDNTTGVYIDDHDFAVIFENFFEAGYDDPYIGNCGFASGVGLDIHNSNGFVVENNKFRKNSDAANGNYAGIRVSNCPSYHDIIYKNELIGLSFGNYAEGTNRSNPGWDATGVEYRCNFNDGNAVDFIVKNISPYDGMIRGAMGNQRPDTACGNFFSPNAIWHIRNEGTQTINWFYNMYNLSGEKPRYIYELNPMYVNDQAVSNANGCPDHHGGGIHMELTQEERQLKEIEFAQNLTDYNSIQALYESLTDGGNTEAELSGIQSAEPDEMWALRTHLLGLSPHLSQEVLRAVSDRTDVFPDEVLLDILSANPDELDKDTLISYLEQKEDPLPDYMLEILSQVANGVTYKTILQEEMAYHYGVKTQAAQDIIRSILNDTAFYINDYRAWLDNLGGLEADKQIIASYLDENDTTSALGLLELIPDLYDLDGQTLDDFYDYKSLIELQIGWNAEGKSLFQLDSLDLATLEGYAINLGSPAGNIAENIFEYIDYQHYCNCLESIDSSFYKSNHINPVNIPIEAYRFSVSVEPNPAQTWIAFNYELPDDKSVGLLSISDASGKLLIQLTVTGKSGQKLVNTETLDSGLYFYKLTVSGLSKAGKFIIQ
jgi:hypothetical protein